MVAVTGGAFMGAYLMWEFFPGQPALQVRAYAMWLCSLQPASMRVTPTLQAHGRVWVFLPNLELKPVELTHTSKPVG